MKNVNSLLTLKQHLTGLVAYELPPPSATPSTRGLGLWLLAFSLPLPREAVGGGAFERGSNRGEGLPPCVLSSCTLVLLLSAVALRVNP